MKKVYIKENQIKLLKEVQNSPDKVIYNCEILDYVDDDAYAFIVNETENGIVVYMAESGRSNS